MRFPVPSVSYSNAWFSLDALSFVFPFTPLMSVVNPWVFCKRMWVLKMHISPADASNVSKTVCPEMGNSALSVVGSTFSVCLWSPGCVPSVTDGFESTFGQVVCLQCQPALGQLVDRLCVLCAWQPWVNLWTDCVSSVLASLGSTCGQVVCPQCLTVLGQLLCSLFAFSARQPWVNFWAACVSSVLTSPVANGWAHWRGIRDGESVFSGASSVKP